MARRSQAIRQAVLLEYERSGLTQAAFAERRGVPVGTLRSWIYRSRRGVAPVSEGPRILPVRVIASTAPTARWSSEPGTATEVEVALSDGVQLRFVGASTEFLVEVVSRLRRC